MNGLLLCPSALLSTRAVCRFPRDLQRLQLFMTPAGRRTSGLICPVLEKLKLLWQQKSQKRNVSTGSNNEIWASILSYTARGEMSSILVFCGLANFLIKVRNSAADSPCYLWRRRGPSPLRMKGKNSLGEKTLVTLTSCAVFKGWKGQWSTSRWLLWLQPQTVH